MAAGVTPLPGFTLLALRINLLTLIERNNSRVIAVLRLERCEVAILHTVVNLAAQWRISTAILLALGVVLGLLTSRIDLFAVIKRDVTVHHTVLGLKGCHVTTLDAGCNF